MKNFNDLPEDIQSEIKEYLRAYDEVHVTYENGRYHFGMYLKKQYGADFEAIGTFKPKDIFTDEERIVNYVNCFRSYPIEYKGKRDYTILKNYEAQYRMVDGDIVIA